MNDEELTAIENRLKAISPGPWTVDYNDGSETIDATLGYCVDGIPHGIRYRFDRREDAQFVAAAPADIEKLIAEVRRLRAALAKFEWVSVSHEGTPPDAWTEWDEGPDDLPDEAGHA
jgi:hypothetical protein